MTGYNDPAGGTFFYYDALGRVWLASRGQGSQGQTKLPTHFGWDLAGRLSYVTYPTGDQARYSYDAAGQTNAVSWTPNGASSSVTVAGTMAYLPFGPLAAMTLGNGLTETRAYDGVYRLQSQVVQAGSGAPILSLAYGYDGDDNVLSADSGDVAQAFRDDVARAYDMMSPRERSFAGG